MVIFTKCLVAVLSATSDLYGNTNFTTTVGMMTGGVLYEIDQSKWRKALKTVETASSGGNIVKSKKLSSPSRVLDFTTQVRPG